MTAQRSGEEGIALVVVMILMTVMLTTGFALASTVDTQTKASQAERVRDASFNLAESALNAQIFALSHEWPGPGLGIPPNTPYTTCTPATPSTRCPDDASLRAGASPDLTSSTWQTTVRDNGAGAPNFYSDASTQLQPGYDANKDGKVWVRAQATAQGHTRTLVALVRSERQEEDLPHAALIAGSLAITNNGNKELIRSEGAAVTVRCDPTAAPSVSCLGQPLGVGGLLSTLLSGRLSDQITGGSPQSIPSTGPAMTAEARERLKATAIANGTYYAAGCPTDAQLSSRPGQVVYIESALNCPSYTSNTQYNSAQAPGVLVIGSGSITFGGNSDFYGVIYNANLTPSSENFAVKTRGNAKITGGVLIDGTAPMDVGSSGQPNIDFDLNAYRAVASYGSAGVIQNTWREIKPG